MESLIQVFRMKEVSADVRIRIIIQLGVLINNQYATNITEPIVYELVSQLDPNHKFLSDYHHLFAVKEK